MSEKLKEVLYEDEIKEVVLEESQFEANDEEVINLEYVEKEIIVEEKSSLKILKDFMRSYLKNKETMPLDKWLSEKLQEEFPEKNKEEIENDAREIIKSVEATEERYKTIKEKENLGITPVDILGREIATNVEGETLEEAKENLREISRELEARNIDAMYQLDEIGEIEEAILVEDEIKEEAKNYSGSSENTKRYNNTGSIVGIQGANEAIKYVSNIGDVIAKGNEKMLSMITTKAGNINQNPNLDGFIFEGYHENTFNIDAATKNISGVRAETLVPKDGQTYGKNSIDVVVKVKNKLTGVEKIVKKYQAKVSDNPEALYKAGDYSFQRKLYGEGHEHIKNANTSVEYEGIKSKAISKQDVKNMQMEAQSGNVDAVKQSFKNDVDIKALSKQIGRQSLQAGALGMGIGMAMSTGKKLLEGEEVKAEDVIIDGIKVGAAAGLSTAIAGGIKTAVEKGYIKGKLATLLKNNTVVGTIACSAVAIIGIAASVGNGDMTLREGITEAKVAVVSIYGGIVGSSGALALGAGAIAYMGSIATVGAVLGAVTALAIGTIGAFAGAKLAEGIARGAIAVEKAIVGGVKNVVKAGASIVKSVASGVVSVAKGIGSGIVSAGKALLSGASGFFSGVGSAIGGLFGW